MFFGVLGVVAELYGTVADVVFDAVDVLGVNQGGDGGLAVADAEVGHGDAAENPAQYFALFVLDGNIACTYGERAFIFGKVAKILVIDIAADNG